MDQISILEWKRSTDSPRFEVGNKKSGQRPIKETFNWRRVIWSIQPTD